MRPFRSGYELVSPTITSDVFNIGALGHGVYPAHRFRAERGRDVRDDLSIIIGADSIRRVILKVKMAQQDFLSYLKTLKPEEWNLQVTDRWKVRDVVAHMVGWEKGDPKAIRQAWETKEAPWWIKVKGHDTFNKQNVELYENYSPEQLIAEWEKWQQLVQQEIDRIGVKKLRSRPDLFGWLFEGESVQKDSEHYQHHFQQIRDAVEKRMGKVSGLSDPRQRRGRKARR